MSHTQQKSTGTTPTALHSQGGGVPVGFCGKLSMFSHAKHKG